MHCLNSSAYSRPFVATFLLTVLHLFSTPAQAQEDIFQGLGDLPGGSFNSQTVGISGDGSVIAGLSSAEVGFAAFSWSESQGMVNFAKRC